MSRQGGLNPTKRRRTAMMMMAKKKRYAHEYYPALYLRIAVPGLLLLIREICLLFKSKKKLHAWILMMKPVAVVGCFVRLFLCFC